MNRKFFFIFFVILVLISPSAFAWYGKFHVYSNLVKLRDPELQDTAIIRLCKDYERQVIAGDLSADITAVHYLEGGNKITQYTGLHSRAFYLKALEKTKGDPELKCFAYGIGLHQVQDRIAHYDSVPRAIRTYKVPNIAIHPILEQKADEQLMADLKNNGDPYGVTDYDEVKDLSEQILNELMIERFGGDPKYINLIQEASDLNLEDLKIDLNIVATNLAGGKWTYSQAYEVRKIIFPRSYYYYIGIGFLFALIIAGTTFWLGKNNWKYVTYILSGLIALFLIILLISIPLGTTWNWYLKANRPLTKIIPLENYKEPLRKTLDETEKFFETGGIVPYEDASGLFYDIQGRKVDGAITQAEKKYAMPVFIVFIIVLIAGLLLLFYLMSKPKYPQRPIKKQIFKKPYSY